MSAQRTRVLKGLLIAGVVFLVVWAFRATFFYQAVDAHITDPFWQHAFGHAVKFALWVAPVILYLKLRSSASVLKQLKPTTRPNLNATAIATALALVYYATLIYVVKDSSILTLTATAIAAALLAPIIEEILFRGFVLPQLSGVTAFWKANIVTSIVFVLTHWPYWIMTGGITGGMLLMSLDIFALSLVLGLLLRHTNSLWPPIAVHFLNNLAASL